MVERAARIFLGDAEIAGIGPDNRALAYGEALFETMLAHEGELPWWERHWARLGASAARLALPLPDAARVRLEAGRLLEGDSAVLKLHLSRSGTRGYAADETAAPVWCLSMHPLPASAASLEVTLCETRLAAQPALAGMKHGNRLEQVLARREVTAAAADEGLMSDAQGRPISATAANLFARVDGQWRTPPVECCGVAGVMRGWLLEHGSARIAHLTQAELESADAVFLCNAVRGILPVRRLGGITWPRVHPATRVLQHALAGAHPGFASQMEAT